MKNIEKGNTSSGDILCGKPILYYLIDVSFARQRTLLEVNDIILKVFLYIITCYSEKFRPEWGWAITHVGGKEKVPERKHSLACSNYSIE